MWYGEEGQLLKGKEDEIMKDRKRKAGETVSFRYKTEKQQKYGYPNYTASLSEAGAQKLIDELKLFRTLIDQSNDAIMVVDPETLRFLDANEKAYTSLDYSREEFLTLTIPDIAPDFGYSSFEEITRELQETGFAIIEKILRKKDGSTFPVEINVKHVCLDREYLIAVARDITDRKQEEERVLRISSQNEAILGAVPDIIMEVDINKVYTWANQAGLAFFGDDVVGKEANFYFEGEQDTYHIVNPLFVGKDDFVYVESWQRRQDGEKRLLAWWCRMLKDSKGNVIGALSSAQDITERKIMEEALRDSQTQLSNALNIAHLAPWEYDAENDLYTFNDLFYALFRTTAEEVGGYTMSFADYLGRFVHPEDIPLIIAGSEEAIKTDARYFSQQAEHRIIYADGEIGYLAVRFFVVKDENGKTIKVFGVNQDITERKKAEEQLEQQSRFFQMLFDLLPFPVFCKDKNSIYTICNKAYEDFMDIRRDEFIGRSVYDISPKELADIYREKDLELFRNKGVQVYESKVQDKTGIVHDVVFNKAVYTDQDDEAAGMIGAIFDITERKKIEEALRQSESKYRLLIEHSSDLIWNLDTTGIFTYASPSWERVTGYSPSSVIGKSFLLFVDPEFSSIFPQFLQEIGQSVSTKSVPEYQVLHADKTWHWHAASVSPVFGQEGQLISIVGVSRDITEQKQAEKALKESEARLKELNATKDKFFSIVAHDLRSPFNSIIGFSELLGGLIQEKDYEGIKEYAGIIQNSSQKVMDLLLNLLEWSHSQTGRMEYNPEYIGISTLINNIAELLYDQAHQKSVIVSLNLQHNLVAFADKAMVSTMLRNLVSNAVKFTPPGGKVTVSTKQVQDDLIISVTDNGVGIKKEDIKKLFRLDENHSTLGTQNEKGTGLGLILCKEFAEKHGGKIWVESEFGKGSTFYLTIPQPTRKNTITKDKKSV